VAYSFTAADYAGIGPSWRDAIARATDAGLTDFDLNARVAAYDASHGTGGNDWSWWGTDAILRVLGLASNPDAERAQQNQIAATWEQANRPNDGFLGFLDKFAPVVGPLLPLAGAAAVSAGLVSGAPAASALELAGAAQSASAVGGATLTEAQAAAGALELAGGAEGAVGAVGGAQLAGVTESGLSLGTAGNLVSSGLSAIRAATQVYALGAKRPAGAVSVPQGNSFFFPRLIPLRAPA
jgi:hypothetical protein